MKSGEVTTKTDQSPTKTEELGKKTPLAPPAASNAKTVKAAKPLGPEAEAAAAKAEAEKYGEYMDLGTGVGKNTNSGYMTVSVKNESGSPSKLTPEEEAIVKTRNEENARVAALSPAEKKTQNEANEKYVQDLISGKKPIVNNTATTQKATNNAAAAVSQQKETQSALQALNSALKLEEQKEKTKQVEAEAGTNAIRAQAEANAAANKTRNLAPTPTVESVSASASQQKVPGGNTTAAATTAAATTATTTATATTASTNATATTTTAATNNKSQPSKANQRQSPANKASQSPITPKQQLDQHKAEYTAIVKQQLASKTPEEDAALKIQTEQLQSKIFAGQQARMNSATAEINAAQTAEDKSIAIKKAINLEKKITKENNAIMAHFKEITSPEGKTQLKAEANSAAAIKSVNNVIVTTEKANQRQSPANKERQAPITPKQQLDQHKAEYTAIVKQQLASKTPEEDAALKIQTEQLQSKIFTGQQARMNSATAEINAAKTAEEKSIAIKKAIKLEKKITKENKAILDHFKEITSPEGKTQLKAVIEAETKQKAEANNAAAAAAIKSLNNVIATTEKANQNASNQKAANKKAANQNAIKARQNAAQKKISNAAAFWY